MFVPRRREMMELARKKKRNDEVHKQTTFVGMVLATWMKAYALHVSLQGHHNFVTENF